MDKRKRFSQEFKLEAVRLLEAGSRPASELARQLGIPRKIVKIESPSHASGPVFDLQCIYPLEIAVHAYQNSADRECRRSDP